MTEAILLVGGKGTRLRPLTLTTPKPMLPVAGVPLLEHLLARAREAGVDHAVVASSYKASAFEEYFGTGARVGLELSYVTEEEPLGTGGGIRNVAGRLRSGPADPVLVFNTDIIGGHDIRAQLDVHRSSGAAVTLHLVRVDDPRAFGCVPTDPDGRVTGFHEKSPEPVTDQINAGCYVFTRAAIDAIPAGRPVSVERETFPQLLASGATVMGYVDTSYWLDLGTPAAFVTGSRDLVTGRAPSPALPGAAGERLVLPGARVHGEVLGGSTVGAGAVVEAGAVVDGSVLLDGARVEEGARVVRSVVGAHAVVGEGTVLEDAVLGDRARVGARCELLGGARVWTDAVLTDGAVRFSPDA